MPLQRSCSRLPDSLPTVSDWGGGRASACGDSALNSSWTHHDLVSVRADQSHESCCHGEVEGAHMKPEFMWRWQNVEKRFFGAGCVGVRRRESALGGIVLSCVWLMRDAELVVPLFAELLKGPAPSLRQLEIDACGKRRLVCRFAIRSRSHSQPEPSFRIPGSLWITG